MRDSEVLHPWRPSLLHLQSLHGFDQSRGWWADLPYIISADFHERLCFGISIGMTYTEWYTLETEPETEHLVAFCISPCSAIDPNRSCPCIRIALNV